ncbi:hypothetical protein CO705_11635 [Ralstonia pickettii]|nr:hypothetical protein CO705_11635 [Ralstonia pickettii]
MSRGAGVSIAPGARPGSAVGSVQTVDYTGFTPLLRPLVAGGWGDVEGWCTVHAFQLCRFVNPWAL